MHAGFVRPSFELLFVIVIRQKSACKIISKWIYLLLTRTIPKSLAAKPFSRLNSFLVCLTFPLFLSARLQKLFRRIFPKLQVSQISQHNCTARLTPARSRRVPGTLLLAPLSKHRRQSKQEQTNAGLQCHYRCSEVRNRRRNRQPSTAWVIRARQWNTISLVPAF